MILFVSFVKDHPLEESRFTYLPAKKNLMKKHDGISENYSSKLMNDLLKAITPEEQARIDHKMQLAAKIYAALKAKGWKSFQLAEALHLRSASLVSKWLSGTHNFTVDTLVDIQRVLGVKLLDIDVPGNNPAAVRS